MIPTKVDVFIVFWHLALVEGVIESAHILAVHDTRDQTLLTEISGPQVGKLAPAFMDESD